MFGRDRTYQEAAATNSLNMDRQNWWYVEQFQEIDHEYDYSILPRFITENQNLVAKRELNALREQKEAGFIIAKFAVEAVTKYPNRPKNAEILGDAIEANYFVDRNIDRNYSKKAFEILHSKYKHTNCPKWRKY